MSSYIKVNYQGVYAIWY